MARELVVKWMWERSMLSFKHFSQLGKWSSVSAMY